MFTALKRQHSKPLRERTKLRIAVALVGMAFAAVFVVAAWTREPESHLGTVYMHLAAVFAEVAITFAVVDALFERNRDRDATKRLAVSALNRIHHHVWVWQGGRRDLSLPQISGALAAVMKEPAGQNVLAEYTQTLFLRLGSDAADSLRHEPEIINRNEHLERAFNQLAKLSAIRDHKDPMDAPEIARFARAAALDLALALELPMPVIDEDFDRNPSIEAQAWRHFGTRHHPEGA